MIGARIFDHRRMGARPDRLLDALRHRLDRETTASLTCAMHLPTRWAPFFQDPTAVAQVYRYPTRHCDFHRPQLSLPGASPSGRR